MLHKNGTLTIHMGWEPHEAHPTFGFELRLSPHHLQFESILKM
jgi:hypothetical protein